MKSIILRAAFAVAAICCLSFYSCKSSSSATSGEKVSYKVANRYFVKNNVDGAVPAKITTQQDFDKYFGAAAVMGKDGLPTAIDFSKEFVVAIALPETNRDTEIASAKIRNNCGTLNVYYRVKEGQAYSYSIRPLQLLVVSKKFDGNVQLVKE